MVDVNPDTSNDAPDNILELNPKVERLQSLRKVAELLIELRRSNPELSHFISHHVRVAMQNVRNAIKDVPLDALTESEISLELTRVSEEIAHLQFYIEEEEKELKITTLQPDKSILEGNYKTHKEYLFEMIDRVGIDNIRAYIQRLNTRKDVFTEDERLTVVYLENAIVRAESRGVEN
jgi:hypothetical protein